MPRKTIFILALGVLTSACGYKQEDFASDYANYTCVLYDQCEILETYGGYEDFQSCQVDLKAQVDPAKGACPDYDKKFGLDCVNAINATTCQQFVDGYWPPACANACPGGAATVAAPEASDGGDDTGA